ncbi:MAG TPA: PVC-type heme-binding CxxCH protein [Pirellulales bacterium]|nr:PVC-type heme-binding CxxCH protein [Pirellulales bacterium]
MKLRFVVSCSFVFSFFAALTAPAWAQKLPEEEVKSLQVPQGMDISLFASEPMITNPAAIDVDTQGRVWVAEIQWYRAQAKNPPADKIKVLEDTDGDGKADKATVFAEGLFAPMSICVAGDKVYVATSPDLWLYEDKNGDLKADGPPKKLLTGFGGHNHDHGAHSLVLGPDHKWWMSHGDTGFDVTGTDGSHIKFQWGAMLRGELDGGKLETVAVNFRNPYEICVNSFGEAYCSDNDNDGNFSVRICWIMEGGNYGWFGGPPPKTPPGTPFGEHWHFRGHIPGFVPATLVTGFGSPCGICYYEGDAFGPQFKNVPLHADAGPREVRAYPHENSGYGQQATSRVWISSKDDGYFRPDDICAAPDGSLYVSDWYDGGVGGHAYNDPNRGRIFLVRPSGKKLDRVGKPGPYQNIADAIEGLKSPNLATQYLARERLLAEGQASVPALKALLTADDPDFRARALWLLDRIGGDARKLVVETLKSDDAAFRALAVRILRRHGGDKSDPASGAGEAVLAMADDKSPEVRREVLLALPKLSGPLAEAALVKLASAYDGSDRYQLEAINIAAGARKAELYADLEKAGRLSIDKIQLMQVLNPRAAAEFVVKSLSAPGVDDAARTKLLAHLAGIPSAEAGQAVLKLAADPGASGEMRQSALKSLSANLNGVWKELKGKPELAAGIKSLLADRSMQLAALAAVGENQLGELGGDVLAVAASDKNSAEVRRKAIEVAAQLRVGGAAATLEKLVAASDPHVRQAAVAGLVDLQDFPAIKKLLVANGAPVDLQSDLVRRLMSSTGGALVLLRAIEDKSLGEPLAKSAIALATKHPDSNIRVLYEKFIPEADRPQRLGAAIKPAELLAMKGDEKRGEQIFFQSSAAQCKNCHRVRGNGNTIGPDLSQIGKKYERGTLLETILDPSKAIAPEYVAHLLETESGQVYVGFLVEKTADKAVLKDAQGKLISVAAKEIETLEPQKKSLMPELVLRDVTAQDAADLLAFLASLKEAVQPVTRFRVLGPFASPDLNGVDKDYGIEKQLVSPDLTQTLPGADGKRVRWELVEVDPSLGFPGVDQVKHARRRRVRGEAVTNYFLVFADSDADQDISLLVGSDDSCKVWVNGRQVHEYRGNRALQPGADQVKASLKNGRNAIVVKVENHQGPGGVSLSIGSSANVQLRTE